MTIVENLTLHDDGTISAGSARLDPDRWAWVADAPANPGRPVGPLEALAALRQQTNLHHLVVGVIGPRQASPAQEAAAEAMGGVLAKVGITVICGGKSGVMQAVCKGCAAAGGLAIGILPGTDPDDANPHVAIPLPTGLSEGRNMVIARAARVLIAVGGSYGTLSEVAYGLHFSKAVIGLEDAPQVEGVQHAATVEAAADLAMAALIATARPLAGNANV